MFRFFFLLVESFLFYFVYSIKIVIVLMYTYEIITMQNSIRFIHLRIGSKIVLRQAIHQKKNHKIFVLVKQAATFILNKLDGKKMVLNRHSKQTKTLRYINHKAMIQQYWTCCLKYFVPVGATSPHSITIIKMFFLPMQWTSSIFVLKKIIKNRDCPHVGNLFLEGKHKTNTLVVAVMFVGYKRKWFISVFITH